MKKRIFFIDFVKALAIFFLILIHTFSFYLNDKVILKIWNFSHFVVVAFVFSSAFILFDKYKKSFENFRQIFDWFLKRLKRLVLPYYIYLLTHYFLYLFFPNFFKQYFKNKGHFFIKSLTLIGGLNHNWFVLLSLELSLFFPFLIVLRRQRRFFYYIFFIFCVFLSIFFINFKTSGESYRFFMIFSWLLVYFISFELANLYGKNPKNKLMKTFFIGFLIFLLFLYFFDKDLFTNSDYLLIKIKYPPSIFFIIYGLMINFLVVLIGNLEFFTQLLIKKLVYFLANYSYDLYFVHFLLLDFLANFKNKFNPFLLFGLVFLGCCFFVYLLNYLRLKKTFIFSKAKDISSFN